jgi:magnesium transporter
MARSTQGGIVMDVLLLTEKGAEPHPVEDLPALLAREDGLIWVDIPRCDDEAVRVLSDVFGFHRLAIRDCIERNRVPRVHAYPDHFFAILHAPELGRSGHVHYIELDQFVGPRYLVTVHGPLNPAVDASVALRETGIVRDRIDAGKLRPKTPFDLSYAIVSALARHVESFIEKLTGQVWNLEQRVTAGHLGDPEKFLEEMFRARHGLIASRTMSTLSREVYGRLAALGRGVPPEALPALADIIDQFDRLQSIADGQKEYLQGVIEFYRTRTDTKMTIAAERLAVIAVVTLPITALSSVYGMNIIVNTRTDFPHLGVILAIMIVMSAALLTWAKRRGWW